MSTAASCSSPSRVGANPVAARFVSLAVAVLCTCTLNRHWAFRHRVGFLRGLTAYLGV